VDTVSAPFLVGLAGGRGGGKTALAHALAETLGRDRVAVAAHDAYYRDRRDLLPTERARLNYEVPDALDRELFRAHLAAIRRGDPIVVPRYCFLHHWREGLGDRVEPRPVVVLEGRLLLHDPEVRAALDLRVYLDAPDRVRLARVLARDAGSAGRSETLVQAHWRTVVAPAHARYVEPTRATADVVLVTTAPVGAMAEIAAGLVASRLGRPTGRDAAAA
jgi:uridine kinase